MLFCSACGQENPEGARFCLACATPLEPEPPERRKLATLLFCDVSGSTSLGERVDAESAREIMRAYFGEMRAAIESHGGTVEKFIGDAVVAVFGVPLAHEDDALRAVRAAWEMRQRLGPLNEELERRYGSTVALRIGVNTGEVVAGNASARQALVTGDAVNVAARLEQAATPGEILLGESTVRLVQHAVSTSPIEPLSVKGKSEPLRAHRLTDVREAAAVRTRRLDTPMVGRQAELRLLRAQLAEVAHGQPVLLTVVGEPGVGKSRLASELMGAAQGQFRILSSRCLQYGDGITYWPIAEIVRRAAGIHDEHSRAVARERIEGICGHEQAAIIAQAMGLADGDAGTDAIAHAVATLFRSLARERPLLLFIDDIHWAEAALLDLLHGLPAALASAPAAILCLARPDLLDYRSDWDASVRLEPLGDGDSSALVGQMLGQGVLPAELSARIAAAAAGNPLFVEELVGMLLDEALIERRDGRWTVTSELGTIAIPATLRELLGARLDRLPPEERSALERGAIEGQVFHRGAVIELSEDLARRDVPDSLRSLEGREIVRPVQASFVGESAYRIRHILIRDSAYEAIPKRLRSTLHERFAAWLEARAGDRAAEHDEIVGYHLEQAFRYREELGPVDSSDRELALRAAERLIAAGRRAFARRDAIASVKLFSRSAALLPRHDAIRLELLRSIAHMCIDATNLVRAATTLAELVVDATAAGHSSLAAHARFLQALVTFMTDAEFGADGYLAEVESVAPIFEKLGDEGGLTRIHDGRAFFYDQRRQASAVESETELALDLARRIGDRHLEFEMYWWLFWSLPRGPRPVEEAYRRCEELREHVRGDPAAEGMALYAMAQLDSMRGRFEDARGLADASAAIMAELGLAVFVRRATLVHGAIDLMAGDAVAAERVFRQVYEELRPIGDLETLSDSASLLAEALCDQGRIDEAEAFTVVAASLSPRGSVVPHARWRYVRARTQSRSGNTGTAEKLAREAIELTRDSDDLNLKATTRLALGEVLAIAGRPVEASRAFGEALDLYERKGNVVSAARTRVKLADLERPSG